MGVTSAVREAVRHALEQGASEEEIRMAVDAEFREVARRDALNLEHRR